MSGNRRTAATASPLQQRRASATPPPANERRRSLSRGRSRVRHGGGEVMVQREVIREMTSGGGGGGGASLVFPMLKRGDYTNWAMVMEVNLQAASLWDAIEDAAVSRREDKQALAALLRSTPPEMHPMLIGKGSAKAAWEAIKVQHHGNDRVRDSRVRRLRTEFETIAFKDGERIDEFGLRITNLAATMRSLGDTCDDEKIFFGAHREGNSSFLTLCKYIANITIEDFDEGKETLQAKRRRMLQFCPENVEMECPMTYGLLESLQVNLDFSSDEHLLLTDGTDELPEEWLVDCSQDSVNLSRFP